MVEMTPADVPDELVQAAARAMAKRTSPETGLAYAPDNWWIDDARTALAAVLPQHEQLVRAQLLAEREQEREEAYARAKHKFLDAWNAAPRHGPLRILPDGALTWRRRTPEERRTYLTDYRDEALAYGIPAALVDLMIGDAEENGDG